MDFEQELKRVAGQYEGQGYTVTVRPKPEQLPPWAKDFKVELLAKRTDASALISVKRNLDEVSADPEMPRYASIVTEQPGWRFDFVILEGERPMEREVRGAREFSGEDIKQTLVDAENMSRSSFTRAAIITAWSGLEAAMRIRLRASGEDAGWGTNPRSMLNELYSSGVFTADEFRQLERLSQLRNAIVHGFISPTSEEGVVQLISDITRRLLEDSQPAKQTA
jgi:uncharacterized protein YutE (UPF0331/DUF86 family)